MVTAIKSQPPALDLSGLLALIMLELVRPRLDAMGERPVPLRTNVTQQVQRMS